MTFMAAYESMTKLCTGLVQGEDVTQNYGLIMSNRDILFPIVGLKAPKSSIMLKTIKTIYYEYY